MSLDLERVDACEQPTPAKRFPLLGASLLLGLGVLIGLCVAEGARTHLLSRDMTGFIDADNGRTDPYDPTTVAVFESHLAHHPRGASEVSATLMSPTSCAQLRTMFTMASRDGTRWMRVACLDVSLPATGAAATRSVALPSVAEARAFGEATARGLAHPDSQETRR